MSGMAIKGSQPIKGKDTEYIASHVIKKLNSSCKDKDGNIVHFNTCTLGSTGKKNPDDYSGDIDIAVELEFNDDNINMISDCIKNYICDTNIYDTQIKVSSGFHLISFGLEYSLNNEPYKLVQVDLMFSNDLKYTKFMYHSPDYKKNESNFKGLYRTNLLIALAGRVETCVDDIVQEVNHYGEQQVLDYWKYTLTYDKGLFLRHKTYRGKRGLLKNPVTVKEDDQLITKDINKIIKFVLGDNATEKDTNSFESLINFIFSDKYKYNNKVIYNALSDFLNDKRHEDKFLDIIAYINKVIMSKHNSTYNSEYKSHLINELLKEILLLK